MAVPVALRPEEQGLVSTASSASSANVVVTATTEDVPVVTTTTKKQQPQKEKQKSPITVLGTSTTESDSLTSASASTSTTTTAVPSTTSNKLASASNKARTSYPWYYKGGMDVNNIGMAFNIFIPFGMIVHNTLVSTAEQYGMTLLVLFMIGLAVYSGKKTSYCILVIPMQLASLILCLPIALRNNDMETTTATTTTTTTSQVVMYALLYLVGAIALAITKVNICMSVCLHRYAAHHAFDCGPITDCALLLLGCLANQGGPLWWASQHRCHHKYCDLPDDPHSPIQSGMEQAFAFFLKYTSVNEYYVPPHMVQTSTMALRNRIMDTWSFLVVTGELYLAYQHGGVPGLYIAYTSGWVCQSITLWFNIVNHPPPSPLTTTTTTKSNTTTTPPPIICLATDDKSSSLATWSYPPWVFLDVMYTLFASIVMEGEHEHHHDHSLLAQRSNYDTAYWCFIVPLQQLGLVWNVQTLSSIINKKKNTKKSS
jgi:fatty-acid desaturase